MGSPEDEVGYFGEEAVHRAHVHQPFYMSVHEVTNAQYSRFDPRHRSGWSADQQVDSSLPPEHLGAPRQPVVRISWYAARRFARWLACREGGRAYRLPTEVEWEWAARAGAPGRFYRGESAAEAHRHANAADPSAYGVPDRTEWGGFPNPDGYAAAAPVGSFAPNGFGLYDVLGNVAEWCENWHEGPYGESGPSVGPVVRGGSWHSRIDELRLAQRDRMAPDLPAVFPQSDSPAFIGFRLVCEIEIAPRPPGMGPPDSDAQRGDG